MLKNKTILKIDKIESSINKKQILKGLTLEINQHEIHVIMGPNGSGKSTLSKILAGHPSYTIDKGEIQYCGENLNNKEIDIRSQEGIFLAFQSPIEISGVTNYDFLRSIYNEKQKYKNKAELNPLEFMGVVQPLLEKLQIKSEFLNRNLNEGFSGGEKKRNEILQMLLLNPKLVILDEIDSGLDIDAIKILCETTLDTLKHESIGSSILIITHNPKILKYFHPTYVHILMDGKIVKTGNFDLINQLENSGYNSFL